MKIKSVRGNANTSDFSWLLSQPYYALSLGGGVISLPMEVYSVNRVWESGEKVVLSNFLIHVSILVDMEVHRAAQL